MKNILVTGGCGYKGHVLVPKLLALGHKVDVVDTMWFGNFLEPHFNLTVHRGDIRDNIRDATGYDAIIHLAAIANDPCGDLDSKLTWETNALATMRLADAAARDGVNQFIYASSASVYGVKEEAQVREDLPLDPISDYNKTKMVAERALLSYSRQMAVQIVRPATVCGLSPRMRFDVSVNLLTLAALSKGEITVFGGEQVRPNVHIDDITDAYIHLLDRPVLTGVYNVGFENMSIMDIAKTVTTFIPTAKIKVVESDDIRSYRVNSDKFLATGFEPKKTVRDAIEAIIGAYRAGARDEPHFHNLKWMKEEILK